MAMGFFMPMLSGGERDPFFASVSLLIGGDAAIQDESPYGRTLTPGTGATISTSVAKFGAGSLRFDGASANSFVAIPGAPELAMGTGDFTFETWVYFAAKPTGGGGAVIFGGTGNLNHFLLTTQNNGNNLVWARQGFAAELSYVWNPTINTWYNVAVSRQGTTGRMFVDGALVATGTVTTNYPQATTNYLGLYGGSNVERLNGYLDEVRLTKGVARYTGAFTPLSKPFPRY